jgi:hypothetical protein
MKFWMIKNCIYCDRTNFEAQFQKNMNRASFYRIPEHHEFSRDFPEYVGFLPSKAAVFREMFTKFLYNTQYLTTVSNVN